MCWWLRERKKCANTPAHLLGLQLEYIYYKEPSRSTMQMYKHISGTQTWQMKKIYTV